jgi:hypothetical protein
MPLINCVNIYVRVWTRIQKPEKCFLTSFSLHTFRKAPDHEISEDEFEEATNLEPTPEHM